MKKKTALSLILTLAMILTAISLCIAPQKAEAADKLTLTDTTNFSISSYKNYLYCTKAGFTGQQLKDAFSGQNVKVYDKSGNELADTAKSTTGCQVRLMGSYAALDVLTVIIGGDVDGNGSVNNTDLTKLKARPKLRA
ncbi:MAG: hypothetical protein IJS94_04590, partial [Clostridia bacterium]|nr:hypothetical protein [Clostridia bacterium]